MPNKMSAQQFGASIKAKHPEYKDMNDEALGKAVLAKYPQYNDMVEQTPASTDPSGRTPTGEPAPGDTRNGVQRYLDNLITPDPRREEWQGPVKTGMDRFAQGVAGNVIPLISHPLNSAGSMVKSAGNALAEGHGDPMATAQAFARPLIESGVEDYQQNGPAKAIPHMIGQGVGSAAAGELGSGGGKLLTSGARAVSEPLEAGGGGLIDRAAGSLAKDFKRGAEPGRAYLEGGGTPALTMRGLADKAEAVKDTAGQGLGTHYDAATAAGKTIPAGEVSDALLDPAYKLRATQNAPGGTGESSLLDEYENRLTPYISSQPEFSPREVFDLKKNVGANTRWSDPSMFDMNSVRQQGVGRLGGVLTDAVPEAGPLNRIYQGSGNLAERAGMRADTGSPPFTSLVNRGLEGAAGIGLGYATHNPVLAAAPLLMDSVPVKTAAGYLLYHGGELAGATPNLAPIGAAAGAGAPLLRQQGAQ
jgi:hypothetical protein